MGIGAGEHAARAYLWSEQGEYAKATEELLFSIAGESTAFVSAAQTAQPYAGLAPKSAPAYSLPDNFLADELPSLQHEDLGGELPLDPLPPSSPPTLFGPFSHQINKGGLDSIIATNLLKPSEASSLAGGQFGVRAVPGEGGFSTWGQGRDVIEFMTPVAPEIKYGINNAVSPPSWEQVQADWSVPEGEYLPIKLQRVFNPDGTIDIFDFD